MYSLRFENLIVWFHNCNDEKYKNQNSNVNSLKRIKKIMKTQHKKNNNNKKENVILTQHKMNKKT